jgi:hypothetical protein
MRSKETLTEQEILGRQALTFGSRVMTGIASSNVRSGVAQLQIDRPEVVNNRCRIFRQYPIGVCLIGDRGGFAMSVGAHIESLWSPLLDMTIFSRIIEDEKWNNINEMVDLVIFDDTSAEHTFALLETLQEMVGHEPTLLVCCGNEVQITSKQKNTVLCINVSDALKTIFDWRIKRLRAQCNFKD